MKKDGKESQASWGGRFSEAPSDLMLRFSESVSFDKLLARFDIQGSTAHAKMLAKTGIISKSECRQIVGGLAKILKRIEKGDFQWSASLEDVHMNIEQALTKEVPAAAKLHTARSRNDQVATDMRLFFKYACAEIVAKLEKLLRVLVDFADANRAVFIPGYTHLQRAQPVSAAHHILAWVEMFARDVERFKFAFDAANVCPFTTGSSLMPQKKNPDAFELMRGKSARLIGNLSALFALVKGLPLTYNRDLQEDKPPIFDSFAQTSICLDVLTECAKKIKFRKDKCDLAVSDPLLLATDLADYFVMRGVPFRKAHHCVGEIVALSERKKRPIDKLDDADVFAICDKADKSWRDVFDLKRAFAMREKIGMPGARQIESQISAWREALKK